MKRENVKTSVGWRAIVLLILAICQAHAVDLRTESRSPYFHRIPLRDADGQIITMPKPGDDGKTPEAKANPYSTAQTCGKCHEYQAIAAGWHFNAPKDSVKAGRPGEPWILTDQATHTQIPLSYRGWNGTFKPADVGMSDFDFVTMFGHHLPGSAAGEPATDKIDVNDAKMRRFLVTGKMEVDCLICHNSGGHFDHESRAKQITVQNIKWAPTVAAGLGGVAGFKTGKAIADSWRPPKAAPTNLPAIKYERDRFDAEDHVVFDVTRRASVNNCYYCHTSENQVGDARWHSDRDVHIRAGMLCVDCHRNGIDHMIVRGYEGEEKDRSISPESLAQRVKVIRRDNAAISEADAKKQAEAELKNDIAMVSTLTCRGCHMGSENVKEPTGQLGSRLGAPRPLHKGLPPVHLEKLTCTACHAGPFPEDATQIVHTSLAHKLGLPAPTRGENTAPVIVQSVFLRDANGKIAPHKAVWPSYWARMTNNTVKPMLPEQVTQAAGDKLPAQPTEEVERDPYNTKPLTDQQIQQVLDALASDKSAGEPVYVAAGKLYRVNGGKLVSEEHTAAKPYTWALAHDVRGANQALGARGCADCHAEKSPIYTASVEARGPVDPKNAVTKEMWQARGDDSKTIASTFAFTFTFRPLLKIICFSAAFIVLAVLLAHGLSGLHAMTMRRRSDNRKEGVR